MKHENSSLSELRAEIERLSNDDNEHRKAFAAIYSALRPADSDRNTWPADIERLREALRECADDLEAEIKCRASGELPRRIARDLETVARARALLTPNG